MPCASKPGEWGSGSLILDIDYIAEWVCEGSACQFRIVPAKLTFLGVTALRIALDYATVTAAMGPFSIHAIHRREEIRERYTAQVWTIEISWPKGEIEFEANGFEQIAMAEPVLCKEQHLPPDARSAIRI